MIDPIAPLRSALSGRYDIDREIGQGGFATVYLATDLKHDRAVAIKVLRPFDADENWKRRFIQEIRLLARLQHPNILPLYDSGQAESLLYYVMPYVKGETLSDRLRRERQLTIDAACGIAREIADALAYAHAENIVHRDIKPGNILLSDGHAVVADFGVARAIGLANLQDLTRTGDLALGTPLYMGPEQLLGDSATDNRSDIYSLGCVLFEMVTGIPPFAGREGFFERFRGVAPLASDRRKGVPHWLDETIAKALARNPEDRFQDARDLAGVLSGPSDGESDARRAMEGALSPLARVYRAFRRPKIAALLMAALVGLAVLAWAGVRGGRTSLSTVAVLPFANVGGARPAVSSGGMAGSPQLR
jgi:serine/threonine-protein kinase